MQVLLQSCDQFWNIFKSLSYFIIYSKIIWKWVLIIYKNQWHIITKTSQNPKGCSAAKYIVSYVIGKIYKNQCKEFYSSKRRRGGQDKEIRPFSVLPTGKRIEKADFLSEVRNQIMGGKSKSSDSHSRPLIKCSPNFISHFPFFLNFQSTNNKKASLANNQYNH